MRVLILGGSGLISAAITEQLLDRDDMDVVHFNRGQRPASWQERVETIHGDRYDHAAFVEQMTTVQKNQTFDVVIEMIGYQAADVHDLSLAFAGRIRQLIFCSTVDVYSKPPAHYPITEAASQVSPAHWSYAQNKAACERLLTEAQDRGDFEVTILRPAHTYNDTGALLHSLGSSTTYLDRLKRGKPILVHGDGQSLWVSCHASDVARGFIGALGNPSTFGKSYSLPGEEWMTWNDIHRTVSRMIGGPEPTLVPIPSGLLAQITDRAFITSVNFQYNNIFDTTETQSDLGFKQTISFAEGARRIYERLSRDGKILNSDEDPLEDEILAAWHKHTAALCSEIQGAR